VVSGKIIQLSKKNGAIAHIRVPWGVNYTDMFISARQERVQDGFDLRVKFASKLRRRHPMVLIIT
jgi:hypothetical protein